MLPVLQHETQFCLQGLHHLVPVMSTLLQADRGSSACCLYVSQAPALAGHSRMRATPDEEAEGMAQLGVAAQEPLNATLLNHARNDLFAEDGPRILRRAFVMARALGPQRAC